MMSRTLAVFAAATFGALVLTNSIQAAMPSPLVIKLEPYPGTQSVVHATVAGHQGTFLFDTGEGVSMISPSLAQAIDCKPWGVVTGFRMSGERLDAPHCDNVSFEVGARSFKAPAVIIFDIMAFLDKSQGHLDGVIGLDLFAGQVVTIEPTRAVTVETAASFTQRRKNGTEIPIRMVRDAEGLSLTANAGVSTTSGRAWMELDTGNVGTIAIAKHIAPLLNLSADQKEPQNVKVKLADGIVLEGNAYIPPSSIMDGNIGVQFLKNWSMTLDLKNGRAWLAPAKG
jgi:hypothetical protein